MRIVGQSEGSKSNFTADIDAADEGRYKRDHVYKFEGSGPPVFCKLWFRRRLNSGQIRLYFQNIESADYAR